MRKKTHEEYVSELAVKNPNLEVIEKYVNAQTKIMHRCLQHNIEWKVLPGNALKGKGCKECMKEKNRNKFVKSHEEYVNQVNNVNSNILVLEKYVDTYTPILHLCKTHNIKWKAFPSNILSGYGCVQCGKEKYHDKRCKKHKDYVDELKTKNPTVEVIGEYVSSQKPILHRCMTHNVFWKTTPASVIQGHGCPQCRSEKVRVSLVKSHDDYVNELFEKNPTIEVVGQYINMREKIKHHCLIHNEYWDASPSNLLKGCGCKKCGNKKIVMSCSLTHEEYTKILQSENPVIRVLDTYVNMKTPILHECIIHNYKWQTTPASVVQGCGCPKCRSDKISNKLKKTHDEYVKELQIKNPNVIVLEKYVDSNTPILHKCLKDGYEWKSKPHNLIYGYGCPRCHMSKGERAIQLWLENHNIEYEFQKRFDDCKDDRVLPFDFYLPDSNSCIEYQGAQHYRPIDFFGGEDYFTYVAKHDEIKMNYCKNTNKPLLQLPYFKNVEEELNNFLFI